MHAGPSGGRDGDDVPVPDAGQRRAQIGANLPRRGAGRSRGELSEMGLPGRDRATPASKSSYAKKSCGVTAKSCTRTDVTACVWTTHWGISKRGSRTCRPVGALSSWS
jgi:hypothetical protein